MVLDHHPVQNSEVYLLNSSCHPPSMPPPSPPSPATPCDELSESLADLGSMTAIEFQGACSKLSSRLSTAVHVLGTEATSLSRLTMLYETDPIARKGFNAAVDIITRHGHDGQNGKLIICGVGKSGHIGRKLHAMLLSLSIPCAYLDPNEGLHGDLGMIKDRDAVLFISNSGKTQELFKVLPHMASFIPTMLITSHTHPSTCELIKERPGTILLPAPLHISETKAFGLNTPTISTTMALALGDALALTVAREIHGDSLPSVFLKNHPGGAIGAAIDVPARKLSDIAISLVDMPAIDSTSTASQVVFKAFQSKTHWVRHGSDVVVSPRRIKKLGEMEMEEPAISVRGLMVPRSEWITIPADMDLADAVEWITSMRHDSRLSDDAILVTMDEDEACGVVEIGEVMASCRE